MRGIIDLLSLCASILIGYVGKYFWSRRNIILIWSSLSLLVRGIGREILISY